MIRFDRPVNLNGRELRKELQAAGIPVSDNMTSLQDDGYGNLLLDINTTDEAKAAEIVAAHNGTTIAPEPTIADKLASVGLSLDELKSAILGGN